jgi:hypothetical protein
LSLARAIEIIAPRKTAPKPQIVSDTTAPKPAPLTLTACEIASETSAAPHPQPFVGRALRREPTPEEIAEAMARDDLAERLLTTIRGWHHQNQAATTELVCETLKAVIAKVQDGEEEIGP